MNLLIFTFFILITGISTFITVTMDWEACKENVLPVKRGRAVKDLSENLGHDESLQSLKNLQEQQFEKNLAALDKSKVGAAASLLDIYIQYFKWIRESYPSNNNKALNLLEVFEQIY